MVPPRRDPSGFYWGAARPSKTGEARPEKFFFGAATSSHQVEGNNYNDWSEWEHKTANSKSQMANRKNWPDYILNPQAGGPNPLQKENYISGRACDHYNRYEEDFDIAKSLGHNAHRFSIEWSRIEPEQGKFNEKEIEHYWQVIKALRKRGIEPFVTLWHWTNPLWIRDIGGWENKKTVEYFLRYAGKIIQTLGQEVKFWLPINEPTIYTGLAYVMGQFPPEKKNLFKANKVLKNFITAYKKTYLLLHKKLPGVMVGNANNIHYHLPFNKKSLLDKVAVKLLQYFRDWRNLKWTDGFEDFIGLNYYFLDTIKVVPFNGRFILFDVRNPNKWISDMGWEIYPEGIYHNLKKLKEKNLPIYITENGLADAKDEKRVKFIKNHLKWVHKAISEGVDVRGYFYWSLLDNFEWDKGFWPRFGLVEVNYKTMERKIRPSALEYKKIIEANAITE